MTHEWKDMTKVKMFKKERKEHPTLSDKAVKTIVRDHIREMRRKK